MGSLFSSPSVPTYSPVQYSAPTSTRDTSSDNDGGIDIGNSDDKIKDVIKRTARGRNSLIQTSYRGVLGETSSLVPQRKSLLGE